jgi:diaminopimelate decarboxylase/aspartate kinase
VPWWENQREALIKLANERSPCYVYDTATVVQKINELATLTSIDGLFYAVKANPHPALLRCLHENGVHFECVSIHELHHVFNTLSDLDKKRVLFTPNFAARKEYENAIALGCHLTIDSLYPLEHWPEIFNGQSIILRLDPGSGAGHHKYVCTGGNESKFGIPKANINDAVTLTAQHAIHVVGLHAHSGSGILSLDLWQETALMLAEAASEFPNIQFINLGGGLGVVDKPGQVALDMDALNQSLHAVKSRYPHFAFWLEPGRFFVAECGVILTKVTQCKEKGRVRFIGVDTGMNSLIRPMLYGAYHEIVNLSRFLEDNIEFAHVVGPICESADTLGYDRLLPKTYEHDVILIANTGAYGHCMGSSYNMRPVAEEIVLEQHAT